MSEFHNRLTAAFVAAGDAERAASMAAYMKHRFRFYGIQASERRSITRAVVRQTGIPSQREFDQCIRVWWQDPYREAQYATMELVDRAKWWKNEEAIDLLEYLITESSWWDTVDFIASTLCGSYFNQFPHQVDPVIVRWNRSTNMWLIRSSLLFQLKYNQDVDLDLLERLIIPHLGSKEFFIQKAIGWSLRQVSKTNPAWVRAFVRTHELKPVSLREAEKYI